MKMRREKNQAVLILMCRHTRAVQSKMPMMPSLAPQFCLVLHEERIIRENSEAVLFSGFFSELLYKTANSIIVFAVL